jgi:ATP-dependent helicase/nuclease subunit B
MGPPAALRSDGGLIACHVETKGKALLRLAAGEVEIEARADRLDHLSSGGWRVVDYKTGTVPKEAALIAGDAPQLPIEAWLLREGAFRNTPGIARDLVYWRLTGGEQPGEVKTIDATAQDYAAIAQDRLEYLAVRWLLGDAPFASRPHPLRSAAGGDYDHLARIEEWSAGEGEA